jgi:hypothetical protein
VRKSPLNTTRSRAARGHFVLRRAFHAHTPYTAYRSPTATLLTGTASPGRRAPAESSTSTRIIKSRLLQCLRDGGLDLTSSTPRTYESSRGRQTQDRRRRKTCRSEQLHAVEACTRPSVPQYGQRIELTCGNRESPAWCGAVRRTSASFRRARHDGVLHICSTPVGQ